MTDLVEDVLRSIGPCVSGQLVEALAKKHGLNPAAARQRLARNRNIKRLAYLPFPRNARFVYFQADYGSPMFWSALARALLEHTVAHGGALSALLARGGVIPLAHFSSACGAPVSQKKHLSPVAILKQLQDAKLVQQTEIPGIGTCVQLSQQIGLQPYEITRVRGRIHAEEILLLAVKDWARKLGLVSYDKVELRTSDVAAKQPRIGTFNWDLAAPSYVAPLVEWSAGKIKPGFLACDVLLERAVQVTDLRPFINKCKTLRSLKGVARCLQIFVAENYSPEALRLAKENGVLPATPDSLFGAEIAAALRQLVSVLSDAYAGAASAEKIAEIFARLSSIEGAATNLRGALFEYIVADLVKRSSPDTDTRLNEGVIGPDGKTAEVDVLAVRHGHSVRFIECKGYKPGGTLPDEMVQRWLENRIPLIRGEAMSNRFWRGNALSFELWTTGVLSPEAQAMVQRAQQASPGKYTVNVVDHDALLAVCREQGDKALQNTLAQHFFEHPLQTIDRDLERRLYHQTLRALVASQRTAPNQKHLGYQRSTK